MPRLFTAIEIPELQRAHLWMARSGLAGARWIDAENFHLTLRFVGDVDTHSADAFAEELSAIRAPSFELRLDGLGSFGGRRPRAVWVGVAPSEPLLSLQRSHERAAIAAGLPPEARNFTPHVTLARLRGARPEAVATYLERQGGFLTESFQVDRFVLMSSRNSVGGGPYVVEADYPLG